MIKCPNANCGAENEDGGKFCECCGTQLPQEKECPSCHCKVKLTAKFCAECGFNFNKLQATESSRASEFSIGDKNVFAGDVVGNQENFKISGSATIIKNDDETKKMVCCHVCGKNIPIIQSVSCPSCNLSTCEECIDRTMKFCLACVQKKQEDKEKVYLKALEKILEDGKISLAEQQELKALQRQLSSWKNRNSGRSLALATLSNANGGCITTNRGFVPIRRATPSTARRR